MNTSARSGARLQCCVPFCSRSRGDWKGDPVSKYSEWICADHWRLVDRRLKTIRRRILQRAEFIMGGDDYKRGLVHRRAITAIGSNARIWTKMKAQAIERAMGMRA